MDSELDAVLSRTPFMFTRCSRDLRYLFVSRAYADMLGRPPEEIVGRSIVDVMGEEGFATIRPHVDQVLEGVRVEFDDDVHLQGIGTRRLRVVYTPDAEDSGYVQGWVASILDISDQKLAADARALLASIVDSSDDAVISKDLTGKVTSWNVGAERIFGYAAAEAVGQSIMMIIPPERRAEEADILSRLRRGEKIEHFETERVRKNGERVAISLTVSPVRNPQGIVIGASKIGRDISQRVRADAERKQLLASERASRAQAESASRAKDEFLATVSHELRTPLNALVGWAAMLQQTSDVDERTKKGLQSINRNARALAQLVDDLLDVSRMISGKIRLDVIPIDIGDIVASAVETVRPAANAKDIEIDVAIEADGRTMTGDPSRLQQAVWNLLSNAVKFSPVGGRVRVSTQIEGDDAVLTVTDSGIGIDPAFLPFVFDRFRQADVSSTREQSGLGLGLAIVRHLVELHGGTVRAESPGSGKGSTFLVRLPRRHVVVIERESAPVLSGEGLLAHPREMPRLDHVRVLIVDDDKESGDVMHEALRTCGASVHLVPSANDAADALLVFNPHLVLSDIAMPGRDGYAVLSDVRARESAMGRRVPVAAVTAYARSEDRARALAAGFDEYVSKPVDPAQLAATVATLVAPGEPIEP